MENKIMTNKGGGGLVAIETQMTGAQLRVWKKRNKDAIKEAKKEIIASPVPMSIKINENKENEL